MIKITTRNDLQKQSAAPSHPAELGAISPGLREFLLANPVTTGDGAEPVQILGLKENKVVGQMNLVCGRVCVEGQQVPILWGSEFVVPPEHRTTGVGVMILLRMQRLPYAVGVVGASQMAAPLYCKLKWGDLVTPRFILLRRLRPVIENCVGKGLLAGLISMVGDLGLRILGYGLAILTRWTTRDLQVEQLERMPEALDPLLGRLDKPAYCHRSAAWLNWVLAARPGTSALYLVRDRQRQPVGYFIIMHRHHDTAGGGKWKNILLGSVKDWMTFDPLVLTDTQLVLLALVQLMLHEVDAIDVCVAEPEVGRFLRRCGLKQMGGMHFSFYGLPNTPLAKEKYRHLDVWRLRPVDGDYFFF